MTGVLALMSAGFAANTPGAPSGGALAVFASPAFSSSSGPSGGTCPAVTVFVSGGSGSYTYAWAVTAPSVDGTLHITNPTSRTTPFSFSGLALSATGDATATCTVTDTVTGLTGSVDVAASYSRTS